MFRESIFGAGLTRLPTVQFGGDHRKVFKYLRDTTGDLCEILSWRIVPPARWIVKGFSWAMVPSRYGKVVPGGGRWRPG